jgi:hypothetical protein
MACYRGGKGWWRVIREKEEGAGRRERELSGSKAKGGRDGREKSGCGGEKALQIVEKSFIINGFCDKL